MKGIKWHYILVLGLAILMAILIAIFWPEPSAPETLPTPSKIVIPWDEAGSYIGEIKIIEGPVVDAAFNIHSMGKPTFLYIGKPYPDPDRINVVIWSDQKGEFVQEFPPNPETYLLGKTVRVRGFITDKGFREIVLTHPANIWVIE